MFQAARVLAKHHIPLYGYRGYEAMRSFAPQVFASPVARHLVGRFLGSRPMHS